MDFLFSHFKTNEIDDEVFDFRHFRQYFNFILFHSASIQHQIPIDVQGARYAKDAIRRLFSALPIRLYAEHFHK